jgi:hypothetical protein
MQILGIYLYVTAVGFVAAGVLASFVQLVSGEPIRRLDAERVAGFSSATEVMVRHLGRGRRCLESLVRRPPGYADAAVGLADANDANPPPASDNALRQCTE